MYISFLACSSSDCRSLGYASPSCVLMRSSACELHCICVAMHTDWCRIYGYHEIIVLSLRIQGLGFNSLNVLVGVNDLAPL